MGNAILTKFIGYNVEHNKIIFFFVITLKKKIFYMFFDNIWIGNALQNGNRSALQIFFRGLNKNHIEG